MSKATITFAPELQVQQTELKCSSGRTFMFRELNALEQLQADSTSENTQTSIYHRLAVALVSVDGEQFIPLNARAKAPEISARLTRLRGSEADELMLAFLTSFRPTGEELKKRVNARRIVVELGVLSGSPEWVEKLPESELWTYYVGYGELHGGVWDYNKMQWSESPKPKAVFAIPAELKT